MNRLTIFAAALLVSVTAYSYEIHPIPQKMEGTAQTVQLTQSVNIVCEDGVSQTSIDRLEEVLAKNGLTCNFSDWLSDVMTNVLVGINGSGGTADTYATDNGIGKDVFQKADNKFDEHLIATNAAQGCGDILILGNGDGSEYYAMATLDQMLEQSGGNSLDGVLINDYAHTQYRGIVEGFYGIPYSPETIIELLEFSKRYKLNTFIYGPKSDPYHLGQWRDEYPTQLTEQQERNGLITQDDIKEITQKADECNVDFVWAIHPAMQNGISFSSESGIDQGVTDIMAKFAHMYDLGVRAFGIFIDDMSYTPSGSLQARLADQAQKQLRATYGEDGVAPLFFVPTAYALNYSSSYTLTSLASVDPEVVIAFTGYDCFSNIRGSACDDMASRVGRNPVMWWNNPVNDDHDDRIYMREVTTHWIIEDAEPISTLNGLVLNPMVQGSASKVALFGAAEYSWNPSQFDATDSWENFFECEYENEEIRDALRLFARNSDALAEDEELTSLYEEFKADYQTGILPDNADKLLTAMSEINNACITLRQMEDMDDPRYSLMYADIKPWASKLQSMTGIIADAITYMKNEDATAWTLRSKVKEQIKTLHTDSAHMVPVFEGSGNEVTLRYAEVNPSQEQMEPFAEYIAGLMDDFQVTLPQREEGLVIISNLASQPEAVTAEETSDMITLKGLQGITLRSGEYIGLNLNCIKDATFNETVEAGETSLALQRSMNGKQWTDVEAGDETSNETAYFRIKNISESDTAVITLDSISIRFVDGTGYEAGTASTNMGTYEDNTIDKVTDNNQSTLFWSNNAQKAGDYIMLDFGSQASRHTVTIRFDEADRPSGEVAVELSNDNASWNEIATFTRDDIDENGEYTCNAEGAVARYVRMVIMTATSVEWLKVVEFSVESSTDITQGINEEGVFIPCLSDRQLTDSYTPDKAGSVTFRFIENIKIESITVFQNTDFSQTGNGPQVELLADDSWTDLGTLEGNSTRYEVAAYDSIAEMRITWDDDNCPSLVEIYPEGTPYTEPANEPDEPVVGIVETKGMEIYRDHNTLVMSDNSRVESVTLWTADGIRIFETANPPSSITLDESHSGSIIIARLKFDDGTSTVIKL